MPDILSPTSEADAAEMIRAAAADGRSLAIRGGATRSLTAPGEGATLLSTSGLSGITAYEPAEMTMTALAGTPMAEIEAALASHRQMLAFDPSICGPFSAQRRNHHRRRLRDQCGRPAPFRGGGGARQPARRAFRQWQR